MSSNSPPPRANRMHIGDDMLDSPRRLPQLTASSGSTVNSPQRPPSSVSARTFSTGPLRRPGQHTPLPPPQAPGLNVTRSPVPTVAAATLVAEATPTAAVRTAAATTASAASSAQREKVEETPRQQHQQQQQHYHLVAVDASPAIAVSPSAPPPGVPASAPASTEKEAATSSPPPPAAAAAASTAVPARATSSLLPPWARLDTSAPQGEPSPAAYVMGLWDALAAATLARTTAARAAAYMAPILRNASSFSLDRGGSAGDDGGHGPPSPGGYAYEGAARYSSPHHRHPRHHGHRSGGGDGDDGAPRTRSGSGSDTSCSQHSALPPPPLVSLHATHAPYQASPFVPASLIEWVPVPGWDDTEMCADGAGGYFKVDAATGQQYRVAYTAQRDLSRPPTVSSSGAATPSSPSPMPSDGRPAGAAGGGAASASAAAAAATGGEGGVDGDGVGPISPLEVWQQPSQRHTTALASAAAVTAAETGSPERAYREGTTETVAGVVRRSSAAGGQRHLRFESPLPASLASPPSSSSSASSSACASADAWATEKQTKKKAEEAAETTYATPAASVEVSPVTLRDTAAALSTGAEMVAHAAEVPSLQAQRTPHAPLRAESTSAGRHREAVPPRPRQAKSPQRSPVKEIAERVGRGLHAAAAAATAVTRVAAHDSAASIRRADGGRSADMDGAEMAAAGVTDDDDDAGDGGDDEEEDGDGDDGTARDGDDDAAAHPPSSSSYVYPWLSSSNRASGTSWGSERNHSRFCFSAELIARKSLPVESDGYGAHGCSVFTGVRTDGTVSVVMLEPYPTPFSVRRPTPLSTPPPPTTTNAATTTTTASTTADGAAHAQPSAHRQEKTWPSAAPPWSPNLPDRPLSFIGRSPSRRRAHTTYEFPPSRPPVSHPPRDTQPPSASSQERGEGERVAAATLPLTSTGLSSLLCSKAGLALTPPPRLPQPRTFPSPQFSPPPPPPHASAQAPQHPPSLALGYGVLPASNSRLPRSVASTAHTSADATTIAADAALTVGGAQSAHPQRTAATTARVASGEAGEREASPAHTGLLAASRAASYGHGGTTPYLLPATAQGLWSPMAPSSSPVLPLSLKMRQTANSTHSTAAAAAAAAASSSPGGPPSGVAPPPAQSSASRAAGAETHPSAVPVQTLNSQATTPPAVAAAPSPAGTAAGGHDAVAAFMLAAARARGQWRPSQSYPPAAAAAASGVTTTPAPPPSTHQVNTAPPTASAATAAVRAAEGPAAGPSRAGRAMLPESDAAATDSASRPPQLSVAALSSTDAEPPPPAPPPPPTTGAAAAQRTAAPTSLLPSWCVALADTLLTPPSTVRHVAHNATASGLGPPMPAAVIGPSMQQLHQQKLLQQQQQQQQLAENAAAAAAARTPSAPSPVSRATTSGSDPDSHTWSVETRNGVTIGWTHKAVTAAERARKAAAAATAAATAAAVASDCCDAALQAVGGAGDEGERGRGVANLRGGDGGGAFLEVRDGGGVASAISSASPSGDTATSRTSSSPVPFCLATPIIGHVAQAARVVPGGGGGVGRDAPRRAEARVLENRRRRQEKKHPEEEEEEGEELQEQQGEEEEEGMTQERGTKAVYGVEGTERVVDAAADTEASILTPSAHNVVAATLRTDAAELRRRAEEEERDDVAAAAAADDDDGEDHDLVRHCPARHPPMVQLPVFTPEPGPRRNTRVSILTHSGLNVQGSINDVSAAAATAAAAAATHVTPAHPPMHVRFTNAPVLPHHGERDGAAAFSRTITTTTAEEEEEAMVAGQRPGSGGDAVGGHGQCKEVPEFAAVEQRGEGEPPPTPPQPPAPGGGGGGGGGDRAPSDWLRTRNVDLSVATTLVRFQQFHQQQQQAMAKKNAATAAHRLMRSLADPPAGATSGEGGEEEGDDNIGPSTVSPPPPSRPSQLPYASHQLPSAEVRAPLSLTVPPARAASPPQTAALPSMERSEGGGRVGVAFIVDREAGRDAPPPPRLGAVALQSRGQDDENGTETLARLADATARTQAHAYGAPLASTARQGREGEGDGGSGVVGVPRRPAPPHLVSPAPPPGAIAHTAIVPPESEQTAPSPTAAPPSRRKRLPPPPLVLPQRENELPPPQQQQQEEEGKETSVRQQQQQPYATTSAGGGHIPRRPSAEHTHSYGRPTQHSPR